MCSLFRDLVFTKKSFKKYLQTDEGEIDTIFNSSCFCLLQMLQYTWNSSCLFTKNILMRACLFTFHISRYLRLLIHIYVCYIQSPHLISIIKCHHYLPQRQSPLTATWRFQQQFVLDEIPLQIALEAVHLTLSRQIFPVEVKSRSMLHHGSVGASSK